MKRLKTFSKSTKVLNHVSNNHLNTQNTLNFIKSQSEEDISLLTTKGKRKIREYEIIKEIGQGAFGSVYLVKHQETNKKYTIKIVNKEFLARTERFQEPLIERVILTTCKHPSIVKLFSSFQSKCNLFFVLEYIPNKDLFYLLKKTNKLPENFSLQVIAELVNVLCYMHNEMQMSHNDLKPGNIMLNENYHIKLIDFATAKIHKKIFDFKTKNFIFSENYISKELIGTAEFISPEMINQTLSDYRTNDIWALGVIIYMLFNGVSPFKDINNFKTFEKIKKCEFVYKNEKTPENVKDLLSHILIEDVNKRYDINQVKSHKLFENVDWENLLNKKIDINEIEIQKKNKNEENESKENNEYWDNFFSGINTINIIDNRKEVEIIKNENLGDNFIENYYYENINENNKIYENEDNKNIIYEGVVTKIGVINKEIKMILYKNNNIDLLDLENGSLIKNINLNKNTIFKIENEKLFVIDNNKFRSTKNEINKWYKLISQIFMFRDF